MVGAAMLDEYAMLTSGAQSPICQLASLPVGITVHTIPPSYCLTRLLDIS